MASIIQLVKWQEKDAAPQACLTYKEFISFAKSLSKYV